MVITQKQYNGLWFGVLLLLLIVQYIRPQAFFGSQIALFAPVAGMALLFAFFSRHMLGTFAISQIRLITIFFLWMVLLVPFSQSPGNAVRGIIDFIPLFPFVVSIVILVNDIKTLRKVVDVFILLMVTISIIGFATHGGGRYQHIGLSNFLTDPNDYALYMNTMLPVCFFMFMYEKNSNIKRVFYGIATLLALSSIIMTYSRGGFLALLCVSGVMWFFSPNRKLTAAIGAVLLAGVLVVASGQWKETVSTSFDTSQSTAQTRLTAWKLSFEAFIDHPIGIGINNVRNTMYRYASSAENPNRWWGDVNHSFWVTALAEGGVIGFVLILMLLYHNVRDCLQMTKVTPVTDDTRFIKYFGYAYLGSLAGFCAAGTFLTVNYYPHLWYISGLIAIGSKMVYNLEQTHKSTLS